MPLPWPHNSDSIAIAGTWTQKAFARKGMVNHHIAHVSAAHIPGLEQNLANRSTTSQLASMTQCVSPLVDHVFKLWPCLRAKVSLLICM